MLYRLLGDLFICRSWKIVRWEEMRECFWRWICSYGMLWQELDGTDLLIIIMPLLEIGLTYTMFIYSFCVKRDCFLVWHFLRFLLSHFYTLGMHWNRPEYKNWKALMNRCCYIQFTYKHFSCCTVLQEILFMMRRFFFPIFSDAHLENIIIERSRS